MEQLKDYLTEDVVKGILTYYGAREIKKNGNLLICSCFIHGGDNPNAFVWNLENSLWYCHTQCKTGGDLLRLHAMKNELCERNDFSRIVNEVCALLGADKEKLNLDKMEAEKRKDLRSWFHYVNKETVRQTVNRPFDIRLLGELKTLNSYRGYTKDMLLQNDVFYAQEMERIAFVLSDEEGNQVGATCRRVNENINPKWLHRPKGIDTGFLLYNLDKIKHLGYTTVYLVEGVIDVLAFKTMGVNNVVATFGCNVTDEQIELLSKYFIEVVLAYDNDVAGLKGNMKAIEKLKDKFNLLVFDFYETSYNDVDNLRGHTGELEIKCISYNKFIEKYKER